MYEIIFSPRARREIGKLTSVIQDRLHDAVDGLGVNPRQVGVKRLTRMLYRLRVGDWRIIYAIIDKEHHVVVVKITRRSKETYTDLDKLF